jgi:RHS repeat-associated protein
VLDRATSVTLPDNSTTTTAYTVDNGSHALVTTVTDALHNVQATHTNGSGKTLKTIQKSGPDGDITTSFEYDGIQRLVRVTDTEGNVTTSTYDMGDRRTEVNHPASGITSFTYDALGNVLTKQTANLAKEGKFITYDYDYQRLTGINYPDHPENNVKYYYGGRNASQNRIGRLMLREDGTGAIEYFYGKMGEVTKTRRTMIVPNQAIATYVTQWTYDSHNRLLEMIYPDEEKITYSYNLGGQLEKVHGYKSYGYDYVSKIGYDKFEQRTYLKYCNGAETFYTYDPQRRRLQNLTVNSGGNTIMDNAYTYDAVSNVLSVVNGASVPQSGKAGGQMAHTYTYDALYRLVGATGTYTGADNKTASYTLAMGYDNMHRITSKRQILTQNNVQFNGTLNVGYDLSYTYGTETGKKFQLANVKDVNYRTEETPSESENVNNNHAYEYDANGNLVYVNTSRTKKDGMADEKTAERKLKWDEENRLLASDDNGFVTNYWYDADGERTVKTSGESDQVYVNSEFAGGRTNTAKFSLYVSPYLVANQGGRYTKHIYIGSQRVVSKIGDFDSYGSDPRRIQYAGSETDGLSVDYKQKYVQQLQVIKDNYATFAVPYNGEDNNDYVDGKGFCCNDGSLEAAQARVMARAAKNNFQEGDAYEKMQFYYHPDHLGSSSYITNLDGEVVQYIEYVPFGEVFIEERNNVWNTPYLFNAKEFDEETGLYYYGARYYDPRLSLWMSTDPMQEKYPQHTSYLFVGSNPVNAIDPDGNKIVFINGKIGGGSPKAGASYWNGNNSDFVKGAKSFFHDDKVAFTDADYGYLSTAKGRETSGYEYAKAHYKQWVSDMKPDEAFNLVSHSMGGAFSKGIEKYLKEMGRKVEYNLMINTYQVDRIHNPKSNETFYIDYQNTNDPVLFWFDINLGYGSLKNSDVKIREKSGDVGILYIHRFPIDSDSKFWEKIQSHLPSNQ